MGLVFESAAEIVGTTKRLATRDPVKKESKVIDDMDITFVLNPALSLQHTTAQAVKYQVRTKNRNMKNRGTKTKPGKSVARHI